MIRVLVLLFDVAMVVAVVAGGELGGVGGGQGLGEVILILGEGTIIS